MSPRVPVLVCCVVLAGGAAAYRGLAPHAPAPIDAGGASASSPTGSTETSSAVASTAPASAGGVESDGTSYGSDPRESDRRRRRTHGEHPRTRRAGIAPAACATLALGDAGTAATAPRTGTGTAAAADGCERVVVYVAGAVARPGLYAVAATGRAADAVRAAGGATAGADMVGVNLAERVADGDEIAVPDVADAAPARASRSSRARGTSARRARRTHATGTHRGRKKRRSSGRGRGTAGTGDLNAPIAAVDLNSATPEGLEALPGVGSVLAGRIVAFRELNGPYAAPSELLDVEGVTDAKLAAIADYLIVR